ncbi:hypothetical protein [Brachybacterium phenoliresistens]|uniref:hypothetical protein n=1 Tax=Brachybacterium phenoliresistens TaxID=396014 RepID=UPI0031DE3D72
MGALACCEAPTPSDPPRPATPTSASEPSGPQAFALTSGEQDRAQDRCSQTWESAPWLTGDDLSTVRSHVGAGEAVVMCTVEVGDGERHFYAYGLSPPLDGLEEYWPEGSGAPEKCEVDTESGTQSFAMVGSSVWRVQTFICFPMPVGVG